MSGAIQLLLINTSLLDLISCLRRWVRSSASEHTHISKIKLQTNLKDGDSTLNSGSQCIGNLVPQNALNKLWFVRRGTICEQTRTGQRSFGEVGFQLVSAALQSLASLGHRLFRIRVADRGIIRKYMGFQLTRSIEHAPLAGSSEHCLPP